MAVLINRLKHKIILQRRKITRNEYGDALETWVNDPKTIFAGVEPLRGNEYFTQAGLPQVEARVEARIRIRAQRGLNPADIRAKHGPVVYDVLAVIQDGRNHETQLMVKARAIDQEDGKAVNP